MNGTRLDAFITYLYVALIGTWIGALVFPLIRETLSLPDDDLTGCLIVTLIIFSMLALMLICVPQIRERVRGDMQKGLGG